MPTKLTKPESFVHTSHTHCELDLPAGSLQSALYALKGGADAVYFGLKTFSARQAATNFSLEDARKLKAAVSKDGPYPGKKIYIALNTLVSDQDLEQVEAILKQINYLKPDGVIVQDLGIAKLIKDCYPDLPLHGSTQLAVHTINGVKELQNLGFSRVVLSRELSFEEVKRIKLACPNIELKVFIHGALCYGFSGLCLASQIITQNNQRSANKGSCAQICRTYFHCKETGTNSWLFSMKDLCLGPLIKQYVDIGVTCFKIEGRMKGPDYAYWCARYYRLILDGKSETDQEVLWAKEAMQVSFSRETTTGFFHSGLLGSRAAGSNATTKNTTADIAKSSTNTKPTINSAINSTLICPADPGHKGIQVGTIDKVLDSKAIIKFTKPVALRDGLKVVFPTFADGTSIDGTNGRSANDKNLPKAVSFSLSSIQGGRSFVAAGQSAIINFPSGSFDRKPTFGTPVYCVSRHNLNLGALSENIPLYKRSVDIHVVITPSGFTLNDIPTEIPIQSATNPTDILALFTRVLSASDQSFFTLGRLTIDNRSGLEHPFIPLSVLKSARRTLYATLDNAFLSPTASIVANELDLVDNSLLSEKLPPRKALGLFDCVTTYGARRYLCLAPVMFDEAQYLRGVEQKLESEPDFVVGLNNIAQVHWARNYLATGHTTAFFADFYLYTANKVAYSSLKVQIPTLIGSYELDPATPFTYVGSDFKAPLFVSRVCLRHHGLGFPCSGCTQNNTYHLEQNGHPYLALCQNCTTLIIKP